MRGTYLSGVYETHPLSYPEGGYGQPEEGQAALTVADGTPLRLLVDGIVLSTCARSGRRSTNARWTCVPAHSTAACRTAQSGAAVEVTSRRLVSLAERSICAVRAPGTRRRARARDVVVRSDKLAAGEVTPTGVDNDDPRVADALDQAFDPRAQIGTANGGAIVERTRRSGITIGAAVAHEVDGGRVSTHVDDQHVVTTVAADLRPGESITIVKMVGYSWSHDALGPTPSSTGVGRRELRTLLRVGRTAARPAVRARRLLGDGRRRGRRRSGAAAGAALLPCSSSLGSAALYQAMPRPGARGSPASATTGHTFWDVEGYVVPALTLLRPRTPPPGSCAWRASHARRGAAPGRGDRPARAPPSPWRTIDGRECLALLAGQHGGPLPVNADISPRLLAAPQRRSACPVRRPQAVQRAPGGDGSAVDVDGPPGPRRWLAPVRDDRSGRVHRRRRRQRLHQPHGPAQPPPLRRPTPAKDLPRPRPPRTGSRPAEEIAAWRDAAAAVHVPWDEDRRVHPMNDNFTTYREWRFED